MASQIHHFSDFSSWDLLCIGMCRVYWKCLGVGCHCSRLNPLKASCCTWPKVKSIKRQLTTGLFAFEPGIQLLTLPQKHTPTPPLLPHQLHPCHLSYSMMWLTPLSGIDFLLVFTENSLTSSRLPLFVTLLELYQILKITRRKGDWFLLTWIGKFQFPNNSWVC